MACVYIVILFAIYSVQGTYFQYQNAWACFSVCLALNGDVTGHMLSCRVATCKRQSNPNTCGRVYEGTFIVLRWFRSPFDFIFILFILPNVANSMHVP